MVKPRALVLVLLACASTLHALAGSAGAPLPALGELAELQRLSRRAARAELARLREELASQEPSTRRAAVRRLAEIGSLEAWREVLAALADPDASVGDCAQQRLAGIVSPDALKELLGRRGLESRSPVVRRRVAEAVGRLGVEVDGELLVRALSTHDPDTSRLLLWSLERLAAAGRLAGRPERLWSELEALVRLRRPPELAARALLTLAALDHPELEEQVEAAVRHRAASLRAAALLCALRTGSSGVLELARKLARDDEGSVRALAIDALEELDTKAALRVLVERLESEPRLALRLRIVEALQRRTGMQHRFDPRPWRLFVEQLPDAGPASAHARRSSGADAVGSKAEPLRLPTDSDRVCFLFDFSGSMWTRLPDGRLPKDLVAERLRAALEGLPEEAEFNLVPYTHEPLPFAEELVQARRNRVREALEYFEACRARGKGNVYDAARLALDDPRVDRVVILTDGVPTGGTHSDLELVVPLLLEHDLLRGVAFDVVLVDAPRPTLRYWSELTERTGGRTLEVALQ